MGLWECVHVRRQQQQLWRLVRGRKEPRSNQVLTPFARQLPLQVPQQQDHLLQEVVSGCCRMHEQGSFTGRGAGAASCNVAGRIGRGPVAEALYRGTRRSSKGTRISALSSSAQSASAGWKPWGLLTG